MGRLENFNSANFVNFVAFTKVTKGRFWEFRWNGRETWRKFYFTNCCSSQTKSRHYFGIFLFSFFTTLTLLSETNELRDRATSRSCEFFADKKFHLEFFTLKSFLKLSASLHSSRGISLCRGNAMCWAKHFRAEDTPEFLCCTVALNRWLNDYFCRLVRVSMS